MNTLDQWESEAKKRIGFFTSPMKSPYFSIESAVYLSIEGVVYPGPKEVDERVLALIDLVRKKDGALALMCKQWSEYCSISNGAYVEAKEALALTEQFK